MRFARCITRLNAHGVNLHESIVFHRSIQDLRLPEVQLPIILATLETFQNPTASNTLRELSIKMYETRKGEIDSSEVFHEQAMLQDDDEKSETDGGEAIQVANEEGGTFLMEVEKPAKSRNKPGQDESAKRGAVANPQGVPNGPARPPSMYSMRWPGPFRSRLSASVQACIRSEIRYRVYEQDAVRDSPCGGRGRFADCPNGGKTDRERTRPNECEPRNAGRRTCRR